METLKNFLAKNQSPNSNRVKFLIAAVVVVAVFLSVALVAKGSDNPPSFSIGDSLKQGSIVKKGLLKFEAADELAFDTMDKGEMPEVEVEKGVSFYYSDENKNLGDIVKYVNPKAKRVLFFYYSPGEAEVKKGFYIYPPDLAQPSAEVYGIADPKMFKIPAGRVFGMHADMNAKSFGFKNAKVKSSVAIEKALEGVNAGWVQIAASDMNLDKYFGGKKNCIKTLWAQDGAGSFGMKVDLTTSGVKNLDKFYGMWVKVGSCDGAATDVTKKTEGDISKANATDVEVQKKLVQAYAAYKCEKGKGGSPSIETLFKEFGFTDVKTPEDIGAYIKNEETAKVDAQVLERMKVVCPDVVAKIYGTGGGEVNKTGDEAAKKAVEEAAKKAEEAKKAADEAAKKATDEASKKAADEAAKKAEEAKKAADEAAKRASENAGSKTTADAAKIPGIVNGLGVQVLSHVKVKLLWAAPVAYNYPIDHYEYRAVKGGVCAGGGAQSAGVQSSGNVQSGAALELKNTQPLSSPFGSKNQFLFPSVIDIDNADLYTFSLIENTNVGVVGTTSVQAQPLTAAPSSPNTGAWTSVNYAQFHSAGNVGNVDVSGLMPASSYAFEVRAVGVVEGKQVLGQISCKTATTSASPQWNVSVSMVGATDVTLSFTLPSGINDTDIKYYIVTRQVKTGSNPAGHQVDHQIDNVASNVTKNGATMFIKTGALTKDIEYNFTVKAYGHSGQLLAQSNTVSATPKLLTVVLTPKTVEVQPNYQTLQTVPMPANVKNLRIVSNDGTDVKIAWDAADFPGGTITGYKIKYYADNSTNGYDSAKLNAITNPMYLSVADYENKARTATISNLQAGSGYAFTVYAVGNLNGKEYDGLYPPSALKLIIPVQNVCVAPGANPNPMKLGFDLPAGNVSGYKINYQSGNSKGTTALTAADFKNGTVSLALPTLLKDIKFFEAKNVEVNFSVGYSSDKGISAFSAPFKVTCNGSLCTGAKSCSSTTAYVNPNYPGPVTNLTAEWSGGTDVVLRWGKPATNGAGIYRYDVKTYVNGRLDDTEEFDFDNLEYFSDTETFAHAFLDLDEDTKYKFGVQAVREVDGKEFASNIVISNEISL